MLAVSTLGLICTPYALKPEAALKLWVLTMVGWCYYE